MIIQTKQSSLGQGGDGKPTTRCIAYLAPDANEDRWLLPVGAHIVSLGTEREGTIITQTHKHYQLVMNGEKPKQSGYLMAMKQCIFVVL